MLTLLKMLLGLADPIGRIVEKIADAKLEIAKSKTDRERIHAKERVRGLEAVRDLQIAESRQRIPSIINAAFRAALAFPVAVWLWKVIIHDKVLGLGTTDDLSQNLWNFLFIVVGFYFLSSIASQWRK